VGRCWYDLFLSLPESHVAHEAHEARLKLLEGRAGARAIAGVDLHHRVSTEIALLTLHLDPVHATSELVDELIALGRTVGIPVVAPERMSDLDRERFLRHVAAFEVYIADLPSLTAAVRLLQILCAEQALGSSPPISSGHREALGVRFRRGDSWTPGRLWSLGRQRVDVASPTPPRIGDIVDIELTVAGRNVAAAVEVIQRSDAATVRAHGANGFGGRFASALPDGLISRLLGAAGTEKVVAPPPRRAEMRWPLRVPVTFDHLGTQVITTTTDLSTHGLFVYTPALPLVDDLRVVLAPVGEHHAVRARARVRRRIDSEAAAARSVVPGFGAELYGLDPEGEARLARWLAAAERRAGRVISVVATATRGARLVSALSSAGYAVTEAPGLDVVLGHVLGGGFPPDLVVVDDNGATLDRVAARRLEALDVPLLRGEHETPEAVRARVDRALCG
jgi:hypothetical protein